MIRLGQQVPDRVDDHVTGAGQLAVGGTVHADPPAARRLEDVGAQCLAVAVRLDEQHPRAVVFRRAAQQLGTLASLPPLAIVALLSFSVINPSPALAFGLAAALLAIDTLAWRAVATMFNRECLVTGRK